jgi:glycosyltransferase involved in cell wall biosynthesis
MVNLEEFCLTIIGNDENNYKNKLLRLINKLQIKSRVRIISERRGAVKEYLIKKCDLFILPSKSENFGNSVLDALKYQKIVAITKEVGISSFIIKYKCGIIIPSNPSIIPLVLKKFFSNKKKLNRIRLNSKKLIKENFDWNIIIKKTNFMYEYAKEKK